MAVQHDVGSRLYIFTDNSGNRGDALYISSHGFFFGCLTSNMTVPAGTTMHFYNPHRTVLLDPGLDDLLQCKINVHESISAGQTIPDYSLAKYQGSHNKMKESYDSIKQSIDKNRLIPKKIADRRAKRDFVGADALARIPYLRFDVLTVRNRTLRGYLSIKDVLAKLQKHGWHYANIYCGFCRSSLGGGNGKTAPSTVSPLNPQRVASA